MSNTEPSWIGTGDPRDEIEASPLLCDEYCAHDHEREFWHRDKDQWFCTACLEEHYAPALEFLGYGDEEDDPVERVEFVKDSDDELTGGWLHFKAGHLRPVCLKDLEETNITTRKIQEKENGIRQ